MTKKGIELPGDVRNRILRGIHYDAFKRKEVFDKFVQKFLKLNSEDPENFNKYLIHFDKTAGRKVQNSNRNKTSKKLTYKKRKELGLFALGRKSLKYKDLLLLHKLWIDYMTKYINFDELRQQRQINSSEDLSLDKISLKLYRADYHGCKMTVQKSLCPSYVGISGIVVMETKNSFKLLGVDNTIRIVPKASCIFTFEIQEFEFKFYGKNLQVKPAERSSKKIKTVYVSDLQL